jgi:hypothetical protein
MQLRCHNLFKVRLPALAAMAMAAGILAGQASADTSPIFESDAVIEFELAGPFSTLIQSIPERERYPATITIGDRQLDVMMRIRGNSRLRVCRFPPLRVYFGDDTAGTPFEGLKSLKLVTHCYDSERGDDNLAEEFAAYRIFNVLTPYSYRTRALRIRYVDTEREPDATPAVRHAFFLESRKLLAARFDAERADLTGVRLSELEPRQAATMYVFQYLIGNTDWSLATAHSDDECCHNVDLVKRDGLLYTLPYDFDLAGLVNPPYAKPDPSLRISRVTIRRYRGYCVERTYLQGALDHVLDQREVIFDTLRQIPIAHDKQVDKMMKYLEPFFRKAEDTEKTLARFEKRCL